MSSKVKTNKLSNYNPALDQYSNLDLFPEKTKRAKEALSKPGVKEWLKTNEADKISDFKLFSRILALQKNNWSHHFTY